MLTMIRLPWMSVGGFKCHKLIILFVVTLLLLLFASSVMSTQKFHQENYIINDFDEGDSFYDALQDGDRHITSVETLELGRVETRLRLRGWNPTPYLSSLPDKAEDFFAADGALDERSRVLKIVPNGSPLSDFVKVSSTFGLRDHPIQKKLRPHKGIDYGIAKGTPVHTTANGVVVLAEKTSRSAYGKYVVVRHAMGFTTLYAHLQEVNVKPGQLINKGDLLGRSGNSGRSTGPHLHYEVHYQKQPVDPMHFVAWSRSNYHVIFSKVLNIPWSDLRKHQTSMTQAKAML